MRKTKIVCTIGPASETEETITELVKFGMDVARINFSHGVHEEHINKINIIKRVREKLDSPIAIMLDTKGPEVRIRQFKEGAVTLEKGEEFVLTVDKILGDANRVSVTYDNLTNELKIGQRILADDGLIQLEIIDIREKDIICTVVNGGELKNNKSLNFPDAAINLPAITDKDKEDLIFGIKEDVDFIAASFMRSRNDVLEIRKTLEENGGGHIHVISKIENSEGVENIDSILEVSDGIMVARGDLGVEISAEEVPLIQKDIIKKCNKLGKPVITATQMLDSMIRNPRPTRAEVTDIANAIFDGTDAIMLSGETAAGKYPLESVETMSRIAVKIEGSGQYHGFMTHNFSGDLSVTNVISHATCTTADQLDASAIIAVTTSGYTARMVSKFRPSCPIIAITNDEKLVRVLSLAWGVQCVQSDLNDIDSMFNESIIAAVRQGCVEVGDLVVIIAGIPIGVKGATNMVKVQTIGDIIIKGTGIGRQAITGKARIVRDVSHENFKKGDILVTTGVSKDNIEYVKRASGIVTEEGGLTSQGAIAALQFDIPIIVGAEDVMKNIKDGSIITLDPLRGLIYNGKVTVM